MHFNQSTQFRPGNQPHYAYSTRLLFSPALAQVEIQLKIISSISNVNVLIIICTVDHFWLRVTGVRVR